jgi:transcriptional regulator with XRE-family HTH domain
MKDRISKFLTTESISPSKFADEIGVQRSSISHIISGRNNPSLELIQKILNRYDFVNPDWLILGKGEMYRGQSKNINLFSQATTEKQENIQINNDLNKEEHKPVMKETPVKQEEQVIQQSIIPPLITSRKAVDKLLIIYKDGTFENFYPAG